ncbi:hypothetical protein DPMN_158540 [Dreissena polymorpha]|uniref:Uncharacterized protein n=1 Tax=Dreissena polymorpha TaxID=45954 RepID=A0A9D4EK04_DREPO|nr:hypothetical protein DPMN_158540 [Dreissena polymorpha]
MAPNVGPMVYDAKARAAKIVPDKWEDVPYVVINQPNTKIPVYDVKKDQPSSKRIRRVHRKMLLPLEITEQHQHKEQKAPRYVIPQRRSDARDIYDDGSVPIRARTANMKHLTYKDDLYFLYGHDQYVFVVFVCLTKCGKVAK